MTVADAPPPDVLLTAALNRIDDLDFELTEARRKLEVMRKRAGSEDDLLDEDIFAIMIGPRTYDIGWYGNHFLCRVIVNDNWLAPESEHQYQSALECLDWLNKMLGYAKSYSLR